MLDTGRQYSRATSGRRLRNLLNEVDSELQFVERSDLGPYVNWSSRSHAPLHRWLRYREAYNPDLIEKLGLNGRLLDPFCGCGSTLIGAALNGRRSIGIDVNPLATFATRVKLKPLTTKELGHAKRFLRALDTDMVTAKPSPVPELSIAHKVFEPEILVCIQQIHNLIQEGDFSQATKDFLLLGWVSILEQVGSYFKEGNGIKYRKKKRMPGRYENRPEGLWQIARFGLDQKRFVYEKFVGQIAMMLSDTHVWKNGSWSEQLVVEGSALQLNKIVGDESVDSIVFSPPYANRFDYFESMKVELWFGGFVKNYEDLRAIRKKSMRSHLAADLSQDTSVFDVLEGLIGEMDQSASSWRMGVPNLLRGYFSDLFLVLQQAQRLVPKGTCNVVVGNSAFAGVIIPTDSLTALAGMSAGFRSAKILTARHLTVSPQQRVALGGFSSHMRESVVVLRN